MKTTEITSDAELEKADMEDVSRHAFEGAPLDPDVARRVRERAEKITEEILRRHGEIDDATFQALLNDDDEDDDLT